MSLFLLVEASNSLDGHVVGLCGPRGENDVFRVGTYELSDVLIHDYENAIK